jgi:hypothetical protein
MNLDGSFQVVNCHEVVILEWSDTLLQWKRS